MLELGTAHRKIPALSSYYFANTQCERTRKFEIITLCYHIGLLACWKLIVVNIIRPDHIYMGHSIVGLVFSYYSDIHWTWYIILSQLALFVVKYCKKYFVTILKDTFPDSLCRWIDTKYYHWNCFCIFRTKIHLLQSWISIIFNQNYNILIKH